MIQPKNNQTQNMIEVFLVLILISAIVLVVFLNRPKFGRAPRGERLERIKRSPNFRDGKFRNQREKPQFIAENGYAREIWNLLFGKHERVRPKIEIHTVKTDLRSLSLDENSLVWFGHSSYLLQIDAKRFLIDPVFCVASPVSFFNKPFKGADAYKPEDMPDIDYLIITHDHWDHLDYETIMRLKNRIGKVICGLGVGEHFEYWGFEKDSIIEMDWNEKRLLADGFTINCLPAHHFSGRRFAPNSTLWASFVIESPTQKIFIAGDGGYGSHLAEIGKQFSKINLAILENGQYNKSWRYIHLMPEYLYQAAIDLNAQNVLTVHHSKYALARHPWDEPLNNISSAFSNSETSDFPHLINPIIGELVRLNIG